MTERTALVGSDLLRKMKDNLPALIVMTGSLALTVVILMLADPTQFINAVASGGMWALLAVGLALIFGVANVPYFAHGESFMVGAYTAYYVYSPIQAYLEATARRRDPRRSRAPWRPRRRSNGGRSAGSRHSPSVRCSTRDR